MMAFSGSAISLAGLATLTQHGESRSLDKPPRKREKAGLLEKAGLVTQRASSAPPSRSLSRFASSVLLVGWGAAKIACSAVLSGTVHTKLLQQVCLMNVPALAGLLMLQLKRGRAGFLLPLELQAVLATAYTAVALGVNQNDPRRADSSDRFFEYLPGRLHLV
jgi:hypothetical protein